MGTRYHRVVDRTERPGGNSTPVISRALNKNPKTCGEYKKTGEIQQGQTIGEKVPVSVHLLSRELKSGISKEGRLSARGSGPSKDLRFGVAHQHQRRVVHSSERGILSGRQGE